LKGLALKETVPASLPITGVDAEVQGAVASLIIQLGELQCLMKKMN